MTGFKNLYSPLKVGAMTVKNRLMFLPHRPTFADPGEAIIALIPGPRHVAYWAERARGGVGWIGTQGEPVHVDPAQNAFVHRDSLARFKKLADAVHRYDARITGQLFNYGSGISGHPYEILERPTPWAPSAVPVCRGGRMPHAMTRDELKAMTAAFAQAAALLREAGYDGVEIHVASGHLLNLFLSPYFNRRSDEYGGSVQNRLRYPIEVTQAVRQAVGSDFTVGIRICADEFFQGGYNLDDMVGMAPALTAGVDYLSVALGNYKTPSLLIAPMYYPLGAFVYCAAAIKKVVDVPVICSGRINDPAQAEQILSEGQADVVGMARALICDPELPDKARQGRSDDIRRCLACNEGCYGRRRDPRGITCAINPVTGREIEWAEVRPAERSKKVVVVGGGPAGLEAARSAAQRGHEVTLFEKNQELGGLIALAAKAPGRGDFAELARYYERELHRLNVVVRLGTLATAESVLEMKPEAVVVATGSAPFPLEAPGAGQSNVFEVRDVLAGKVEVGSRVLVVDGENGIRALSVADLLASQGKEVEVVCAEFSAGDNIDNIDSNIRSPLYQRLLRAGVRFSPITAVKEIRGNSVVLANVFTGEERSIEGVDTIVYSCGDVEDNALYLALKDRVPEVYAVGDCAGVRKLVQATQEGAVVGHKL